MHYTVQYYARLYLPQRGVSTCTALTTLFYTLLLTLLHDTILCFATLLDYSLKILVLYYPIFLNYSTLKSLYFLTFCGGTEKGWAPFRNSTMFYHTITRLCFYQHSTGEYTMIYHIKLYITVLFYRESTHYCCTVLWHGRALTSGPSFCSMLYLSLDFCRRPRNLAPFFAFCGVLCVSTI